MENQSDEALLDEPPTVLISPYSDAISEADAGAADSADDWQLYTSEQRYELELHNDPYEQGMDQWCRQFYDTQNSSSESYTTQ
jgi:hypothetical protein